MVTQTKIISLEEYIPELDEIIRQHKGLKGSLIQVLHKAQQGFGYLPIELQKYVAEGLKVPYSEVYSVVTFYSFFSMEPKGRHIIKVCLGTACFVRGSAKIVTYLEEKFGIPLSKTTEDRRFTLDSARCLGACSLAPVMMVNEDVYGRLTPEKAYKILMETYE
ncbi:MAG: NAD(P)H-dependent oxidoreductase subunit E [Candidatus Coatesbacteria bacterium]|nr:NAD(P)H-dependent oxidoreductase subunit E [Candidatus Coatesbacteria bacterium]